MSYRQISDFAGNIKNVSNDPLTYCVPDFLNSQFLHGSDGRTFGKYNRSCGIFMSNRCSQNWDAVCEAMSEDKTISYPDMTSNPDGDCTKVTTAGDALIRDTAYIKYLLYANNCNVMCEPFNPNAADSPTICYLSNDACGVGDGRSSACGVFNNNKLEKAGKCARDNSNCQRVYGLTDVQLDNLDKDVVMNKLIDRPDIAPHLLSAIYISSYERGILPRLRALRLGKFYELNGYSLA